MEEERRKSSRTPFYLEIEMWGQDVSSSIRNLSTSGVFIYTEEASQYKPGDKIDLVLKLPTEEEAMLLQVEVIRVTEDGIGVKFLNLTPYYAEMIKRCYTALRDQLNPGR
jgi:Tfp pilus assembly protein PilZ